MTTPIADAIRVVAARVSQTDGAELRRLAAIVQRLERTLDEIAADAMTDATAPREGNVVAFRGKGS